VKLQYKQEHKINPKQCSNIANRMEKKIIRRKGIHVLEQRLRRQFTMVSEHLPQKQYIYLHYMLSADEYEKQ